MSQLEEIKDIEQYPDQSRFNPNMVKSQSFKELINSQSFMEQQNEQTFSVNN